MKIGIVNDLPMAVETLRRAIAIAPEHKIIWVAKNGREAVAHCAIERPDLVLMDLVMPEMNGVEATRQIMMYSPCAILIVTASIEANAGMVFNALGNGAVDVVHTPALGFGDPQAGAQPLLAKINTIGKLLGEKNTRVQSAGKAKPATIASPDSLVVIGASAGGPAALSVVLKALPRDFPAAVIVVQHLDERFLPGMAHWLANHCQLPVRLAKEGETPQAGIVLLAGTGEHLVFKGAKRLGYTSQPANYNYCPSVDVLFQSVGKYWSGAVVGVLLTGMGRDGASGLKKLRSEGYHTIAQDEASSAVFGMPKAAIAMDAAVDVLPLKQIGQRLSDIFMRVVP